jgi:hypothetical protein
VCDISITHTHCACKICLSLNETGKRSYKWTNQRMEVFWGKHHLDSVQLSFASVPNNLVGPSRLVPPSTMERTLLEFGVATVLGNMFPPPTIIMPSFVNSSRFFLFADRLRRQLTGLQKRKRGRSLIFYSIQSFQTLLTVTSTRINEFQFCSFGVSTKCSQSI